MSMRSRKQSSITKERPDLYLLFVSTLVLHAGGDVIETTGKQRTDHIVKSDIGSSIIGGGEW